MLLLVMLVAPAACGMVGVEDDALGADSHCDSRNRALLITEIMPNPIGPDADGEWIELFNSGNQPLCLDGSVLHLGLPWAPKTRTLRHVGCMPPQALWVLAPGTDASPVAGHSQVHHRYGSLLMPNGMGVVCVSCDGETLDAVEYGVGAVAAPRAGRALARVPMARDADFCWVTAPPDQEGNMGSPGWPNPGCATCRDGGDGPQRAVQFAQPGDVEVIGWQPRGRLKRPLEEGAWAVVTLRTGARAVDLAGLVVEAQDPHVGTRSWQMPFAQCHSLAAHSSLQLPLMAAKKWDGASKALLGGRAPARKTESLALHHGRGHNIGSAKLCEVVMQPAGR